MASISPRPKHDTRPAEALILTAKSIAKLDCRSGMPTLTMLAPTGVQLLVAIWRVTGGYAEPKGAEAISPTGGHLPGDVPRNCLAGALCRTFDGGAARECVLNGGLTGAGPVVDGSSACPLTWTGMPARPHGWSVHRFTVADDLRCLADHPCSLADAIRSFRIFVYSPHAKPNFARTDESPCSGHRVGSAALREKPFSVDLPAGEQALSPSGGRTRYNRRGCSLGGGAYPGMAAGQMPTLRRNTRRQHAGTVALSCWLFGSLGTSSSSWVPPAVTRTATTKLPELWYVGRQQPGRRSAGVGGGNG